MIDPLGSPITFTNGSDDPIILAMESLVISRRAEDFTRQEYTAELEQKVKEYDGSEANFDFTAKSTKWQIFTGCGPETARRTTPDDSMLLAIFQRFDTVTYEISGTDSTAAAVGAVNEIYKAHMPLYATLAALRNFVRADISIDTLKQLQDEDYSFLTSSGLTIYAPAAKPNETLMNCLIKKFSIVPTVESPDDESGSTSTVFQAWSAEVEAFSITTGTDNTWRGQ